MYIPTEKELEEMGFVRREWEGVTYGWDCRGLDYSTGDWVNEPQGEKSWTIGSRYVYLKISKREEVEYLLKLLILNPIDRVGENE